MADPRLEEIEAKRQLLFQFEESPVWEYVRSEMQRVLEQDLNLLIVGTGDAGKDDAVRGGIAATKDLLDIPNRLETELRELEEEVANG